MVGDREPDATGGRRLPVSRAVLFSAAALVLAGVSGWVLLRPDPDGLDEVVAVDAVGDTLVYSGPVRDAIARARIVEAFNSVAAPAADSGGRSSGADVAGSLADARAARQAAVDELARLHSKAVDPAALLGALNLAIIDFPPAAAALPDETAGFIQAAAETIARTPEGTVISIVGYAGDGAEDSEDLALSEARADAVAKALTDAGLGPERIRVEGLGDSASGHAGDIVFRLAREADAPPADSRDPVGGNGSDDLEE